MSVCVCVATSQVVWSMWPSSASSQVRGS